MTLVVLTNFFLWVAKVVITLTLIGVVVVFVHHVRDR